MKEFLLQLTYGIKSIPKKCQEIYELLRENNSIQESKNFYQLKENYIIGSIDISRGGRVFLCAFKSRSQKDFFIDSKPKSIGQDDIVLARLLKIRGKTKAKIITMLYSQSSHILCYLEKIKGEIVGILIKDPYCKPIRLGISQKSLFALPKHCVVSIDAHTNQINEVLGVLEDPQIDEKISLFLYHHPCNFSSESLKFAESFGQEVDVGLYSHRRDLRHLAFCTIDPDDAKDHDDGIYFDVSKHELYVAIADVSEYVSPDCPLDLEAKKRGFSVYFPHISYPMLPKNLSENICSLHQDKDRLAFVWRLRLHRRNFDVIDAELFEAVVHNYQNISYTNVDKLLKNEEIAIDDRVKESILNFYPIAQKIHSKRLKKGYEFFNDEIKLELNSNGMLQKVNVYPQTFSHMIVEEAMLLANKQTAKFLREHLQNNGIYRVHEHPSKERIDELFFELNSLGYSIPPDFSSNLHQCLQAIQTQAKKKNAQKQIDKMIIKAQSQANYSPYNLGHFGLGFEEYTHFTSPIRRYSDLMLHRILKQILLNTPHSNKKLMHLLGCIQASCMLLNDQERQVFKIETDFKNRKYARWAFENIGFKLKASITDENYPPLASGLDTIIGARLIVEKLPLELHKFDEVCVQIVNADILSGKIFVRVIKG
ncbi:ribonuclease R family protein [Helicobacter sp. 11S03491-1]|uniref:RNB domain-containing ribonuclease n=1 Tax=Helicobacter sp. 11S03491-1 TaxID=1476196 RepID=UPI000BA5D860|nr:ribonuclease R family protein [Helicobacter sp. 11S03491-1]PAF42039.1 hypothetical protein BKH45_05520 [Helicobacter sp. 11S03491-1]